MKKYIILSIVALLLIVPISGATAVFSENKSVVASGNASNGDFTHTVFIEFGTMTTCGPCVKASDQLYSIYNSGDLDFNYVALVWDEANFNVRGRLRDLGVVSVPDVFFDGGYKRIIGSQPNENPYRTAISQSGEREVPDIDINVDVTWLGTGRLKIIVTVTNNEVSGFSGIIRAYVVEKESRWNDNSGKPYHYATLDIPIDKRLSVPRSNAKPLGDTYTFEKTWVGSLYGFGDITKENTIVFASVFEKKSGYVVETAAAEPIADSSQQSSQYLISPLLFRIFKGLLNHFPLLEQILNLI